MTQGVKGGFGLLAAAVPRRRAIDGTNRDVIPRPVIPPAARLVALVNAHALTIGGPERVPALVFGPVLMHRDRFCLDRLARRPVCGRDAAAQDRGVQCRENTRTSRAGLFCIEYQPARVGTRTPCQQNKEQE